MKIRDRVPARTRVRLTRTLLDRPRIAGPYLALRPGFSDTRLTAETSIIVDGFPRSANSYVFYGLRIALGPDVVVRGHTHSSATLIKAARRGVPAVMLVRDPDAAVSSFVQMVDGLSPRIAYDSYSRFYSALNQYLDELLVVSFATAIEDLGKIISAVNGKTGAGIFPVRHTPDLDAKIRRHLEHVNRELNGGHLREAGVARPSTARKGPAEMVAHLDVASRAARDRAATVYANLMAAAI